MERLIVKESEEILPGAMGEPSACSPFWDEGLKVAPLGEDDGATTQRRRPPRRRACRRSNRHTARTSSRSSRFSNADRFTTRKRSVKGSDNVHWRWATGGNSAATRTPVSTARRLVDDGHQRRWEATCAAAASAEVSRSRRRPFWQD
jgi:hypothetical protein